MRKRRATKTDRINFAIEPQLRERIVAIAECRDVPLSSMVRTMLRDQLAIVTCASADNRQVAA